MCNSRPGCKQQSCCTQCSGFFMHMQACACMPLPAFFSPHLHVSVTTPDVVSSPVALLMLLVLTRDTDAAGGMQRATALFPAPAVHLLAISSSALQVQRCHACQSSSHSVVARQTARACLPDDGGGLGLGGGAATTQPEAKSRTPRGQVQSSQDRQEPTSGCMCLRVGWGSCGSIVRC